MMEFKNIFVTVGTTEFKKLINKLQDKTIADLVKRLGCKELTIQAGAYSLESFNSEQFRSLNINVNIYNYADSLKDDMTKADLIIGHAGAGTCLEGLRLDKTMLIVVNEDLMDNHQLELAVKLSEENYADHCTIETLDESLERIRTKKFRQFPREDTTILSKFIDNLFSDLN